MPEYSFKFGTINIADGLPVFSPELCQWIEETAEARVRAVLDAVVQEALQMALAANIRPSDIVVGVASPPATTKPVYLGPERRSVLSQAARESSFMTMNESQRQAWEILQRVDRAEFKNATPAVVYRDEEPAA